MPVVARHPPCLGLAASECTSTTLADEATTAAVSGGPGAPRRKSKAKLMGRWVLCPVLDVSSHTLSPSLAV